MDPNVHLIAAMNFSLHLRHTSRKETSQNMKTLKLSYRTKIRVNHVSWIVPVVESENTDKNNVSEISSRAKENVSQESVGIKGNKKSYKEALLSVE